MSLVLVLMMSVGAGSCEPAPDIQRALQAAATVVGREAMDFDGNIASLRALRARYPDDLFVHEQYQDGVARFGIEGHVNAMVQEYQDRASRAPDDLLARYLFARALIGRSTSSAIQALVQIASDHPEFAPAHRALAAIYATQPYHDAQGARAATDRLQVLCPPASEPTSGLTSEPERTRTPWPVPLPPPGRQIDAAERLLAERGDADRVLALALQGIREEEWRLQRMRPFDWFSVEEKRQAQRALLANYWRLWSIQVRCHRLAGHPDQANQLLAQMERRAVTLDKSHDPAAWDARMTLARLYAEEDQGVRLWLWLFSIRS